MHHFSTLGAMGCIGSKQSPKKDESSLRKQLSLKKVPSIKNQPSAAKEPKQEPSQSVEANLEKGASQRSKDKLSVPSASPRDEEEGKIIVNENFDWGIDIDIRTKSEKEKYTNGMPRTPTPTPSPSLRKSPAFQMRGRRLSEGG